jgi:hypothetical protein
MDWLLLIFGIAIVGHSFYAWAKKADAEWMWIGVIGIVATILLSVRIVFLNNLPENLRPVMEAIRYFGWILVLVALTLTEIRKRKK